VIQQQKKKYTTIKNLGSVRFSVVVVVVVERNEYFSFEHFLTSLIPERCTMVSTKILSSTTVFNIAT